VAEISISATGLPFLWDDKNSTGPRSAVKKPAVVVFYIANRTPCRDSNPRR